MYVLKLADGATAAGAQAEVPVPQVGLEEKQCSACLGQISGLGSVALTVQGRPDPSFPWVDLKTLNTSAAGTADEVSLPIYPEMRVNITSLTAGVVADAYLIVYNR